MPPDFINEIAQFTLKVCTPLCWHDRKALFPKPVNGASCFVLRFPDRLVGITAAHVVAAYDEARQTIPNFVCQLRMMEFRLHEAIIDCDDHLDIATFGLSEDELKKIDGLAIDCRGDWPPPEPQKNRALSWAGLPNLGRTTSVDKSAVFQAYGALPMVEDFTEQDIWTTYDPQRDNAFGGTPKPPLGLNISGCSGGPALMHGERNGLHRWFPVGFIVAGPRRDQPEPVDHGAIADIETICIRRVHVVKEDGSIKRNEYQTGGWLPGQA